MRTILLARVSIMIVAGSDVIHEGPIPSARNSISKIDSSASSCSRGGDVMRSGDRERWFRNKCPP